MKKEIKPLYKNLWIIILIILGAVISIELKGNIENAPSQIPVNDIAQKAPASQYGTYLDKIVFEDINLRASASQMTKGCSSGNKECQLNAIYRYVVKNYSYYSDPRYSEFIQSPQETMNVGRRLRRFDYLA